MRETKHIEIDGVSFSLIPIIPFEEWVETKYGTIQKFQGLTRKDKEKIFLRWKWGFEDENANENLEASEEATPFQFKDSDLSELPKAVKFHMEHKRNFDRVCYKTKKRIGLIFESSPLIDKIVEVFDAREQF